MNNDIVFIFNSNTQIWRWEESAMSSLGTSKGILEIAKFGVYVTVPIVLMYAFANNTKNLQKFMGNRSYIVYPPEGPRPQSPEELREIAREIARERKSRSQGL